MCACGKSTCPSCGFGPLPPQFQPNKPSWKNIKFKEAYKFAYDHGLTRQAGWDALVPEAVGLHMPMNSGQHKPTEQDVQGVHYFTVSQERVAKACMSVTGQSYVCNKCDLYVNGTKHPTFTDENAGYPPQTFKVKNPVLQQTPKSPTIAKYKEAAAKAKIQKMLDEMNQQKKPGAEGGYVPSPYEAAMQKAEKDAGVSVEPEIQDDPKKMKDALRAFCVVHKTNRHEAYEMLGLEGTYGKNPYKENAPVPPISVAYKDYSFFPQPVVFAACKKASGWMDKNLQLIPCPDCEATYKKKPKQTLKGSNMTFAVMDEVSEFANGGVVFDGKIMPNTIASNMVTANKLSYEPNSHIQNYAANKVAPYYQPELILTTTDGAEVSLSTGPIEQVMQYNGPMQLKVPIHYSHAKLMAVLSQAVPTDFSKDDSLYVHDYAKFLALAPEKPAKKKVKKNAHTLKPGQQMLVTVTEEMSIDLPEGAKVTAIV